MCDYPNGNTKKIGPLFSDAESYPPEEVDAFWVRQCGGVEKAILETAAGIARSMALSGSSVIV